MKWSVINALRLRIFNLSKQLINYFQNLNTNRLVSINDLVLCVCIAVQKREKKLIGVVDSLESRKLIWI